MKPTLTTAAAAPQTTNYTPIGNINHLFGGEFDGGGHTVSGIRIRKTGSDNTEEVHGFFGQIDTGANIHDLHLTDTRITGYDYVGGIVGYIKSGTVSNCTVSESAITATNDEDDVCCGTICGINYGTLSHNYYHHCTVNGTAVTSGAGSEKEDVTDNDGAVPFPALIDTEDNTAIITKYNGQTIPVVLEGRTLYKDGAWNTLCLPFDLTIADSPLDGDGVDVRTLSSSDFQEGTLTLTFTNAGAVTKLQAGRPYIIKWNNTGHHLTDNDLVFLDAEVSATTPATETAGSEWVDFCGTYAPQPLYESGTEKHNLYLGADNTLYNPTVEGFKVNAFRGWFQLKKGLTAGTPSAHVRAFSLNFGDGSEETGIWEMKNEQLKMNNEAGAWYTLDGVKLNAQPTHKGLYIHGGRKVAIK